MYDCQQRIPFLDTNSLPRRNLGVIGRLWVHKDPVGQFIVDLRQSARRRLHRYDQVLGKISIEIAGAGAALLKLDRNGDGKLTPDEVFGPGGPATGAPVPRPGDGQPPAAPPGQRRPGQRGLGGLNPEEFRERLKEADANKDGKISKEEAPPLLKDRFDRIDTNGDGFVDEAEVKQLLERMRDAGGKAPPRRPGGEQPRRPDADKK